MNKGKKQNRIDSKAKCWLGERETIRMHPRTRKVSRRTIENADEKKEKKKKNEKVACVLLTLSLIREIDKKKKKNIEALTVPAS